MPNEDRDLPLLRLVLHSSLITSTQLFALLQAEGKEKSRRALSNRLKRLVLLTFLECQPLLLPNLPIGYRITAAGAQFLVDAGEPCAQHFDVAFHSRTAVHWIRLNQLRIAMRGAGLLGHWLSRTEIHYRSLLQSPVVLVDYDAIVAVHTEMIGNVHLGLLYESNLRTAAEYNDLQNRLEQDAQLQWILYLAPEEHASHWLRSRFSRGKKYIGITTMEDFQSYLLEASAYIVEAGQCFTLSSYLRETRQPSFVFSEVDRSVSV